MKKLDCGYITICQNSPTGDYVRMAYALALSLRSQSAVNRLSIIIDASTNVPIKWRDAFDRVIVLENDHAAGGKWKIHNKSQVYALSPYESTVLLDADMLFHTDVSSWWDILCDPARPPMQICSSVRDYTGRISRSTYYRRTFDANTLPNVYTAFAYFRKHRDVEQIFTRVMDITAHWSDVADNLLPKFTPKGVSGDVAFALALKIDDPARRFLSPGVIPSFVHLKTRIQDWPEAISEDWTQIVHADVLPDGRITVAGHSQTYPVHYHCKTFLTDERIGLLERLYG